LGIIRLSIPTNRESSQQIRGQHNPTHRSYEKPISPTVHSTDLHIHNRAITNLSRAKRWQAEVVIYVLKLVPRLYADSAWTKERYGLAPAPFRSVSGGCKSGQLILAARTSEPGDKTFSIAIFEASDEDAARKFMQDDPAVAGG
jgi:hypothetical protein